MPVIFGNERAACHAWVHVCSESTCNKNHIGIVKISISGEQKKLYVMGGMNKYLHN